MLVIYGSSGYTGRLIVAEALARGLRPTLAGRNRDAVGRQAEALGLEWRIAALDDARAMDAMLDGAKVMLNCAGPFIHTWRAMSDACLRRRVHYLDITGEIPVFEGLAARDAEARAAGILLLPGVGFDIVPSDCLAAHLARRLPTATHLSLAFHIGGGMSRGTASTVVANLGGPGAVRRGGRIVPVPPAWKTRTIDFGDGRPREATTIPWGDVATAWHSTGIPNIEVYMTMRPALRRSMLLSRWIAPLLRTGVVRNFMLRRVRAGAAGPSDAVRARTSIRLWGQATAADGMQVQSRLRGPNTYDLTAQTAVLLAAKAMGGNAPAGFQTPSRAYGAEVVLEVPGTYIFD